MASITRDKNGHRRIQFVASDGKRPAIRLGKVSLKQAEYVKVHIEQLVGALITGHAVADETARWVAQVDQRLADKLNRVGLVPKQAVATVGAFIDAYILDRDDVKPSTTRHYYQARRDLVAFFGSDTALDVQPSLVEGVNLPVHTLLIAGLGMNIFDNVDLEALAETSAQENRWEFMLTAGPIPVTGGTGSPLNALAIF